MEVSHATSETQSVAIGITGQAEEVTVSTDAEFMMTIAHGIYSNKALALVRELICNARDGHAKANNLAAPIIITLTDNMLVVRDHGTGIPNAIFARTYMTFGESTKRQDKAATGGFGVGTKVPWAVCDVFSARNFIDGTMTAYSIVKSDPTMEGKPTCTPVMSIPTAEHTGVEVSVPFPEKMRDDIYSFVLNFSDELNIPVQLNGTLLTNRTSYNHNELTKHGFSKLSHHPKTVIQHTNFYVRQGDVIYPIECQEEFSDAFDMLMHLNGNSREPMLFMAEPDSIIPTLSRESLQYTDRTSESIRDLMKKALKVVADNVDEYAHRTFLHYPPYLSNYIDFMNETWNGNFELSKHLSHVHIRNLKLSALSETENSMLMHNMNRWLNARTPYVETLVTVGKAFKDLLTAEMDTRFRNNLRTYSYLNYEKLVEVWIEKNKGYNVSKDFKQKLVRNTYEEIMFWREEYQSNPNVLEVYIVKSDDFRFAGSSSSKQYTNYFLEISQIKDLDVKKQDLFANYQDWQNQALYVSNTVIISTTPAALVERANQNSAVNTKNVLCPAGPGRVAGARCVRVKAGVKPDELETLKQRYVVWGYDVIVLLEPTLEEIAERDRLAAERALIKQIPLPTLHSLIRERIPSYPVAENNVKRRKLDGMVRDQTMKGEPLYYILPRGKELPYNMNNLDDFVRVTKFVGTDIVCVSTKTEITKVIKEGRRSLEDAILDVAKWFYSRHDIYEKLFYRGSFFNKRASQNRYLTKYLFNREPPVLTAEELRIYDGLRQIANLFILVSKYINQREDYFRTCCTPEKHYNAVFEKYAENNFFDVRRALDVAYQPTPTRQRAIARSLLKTILKETPA